MLLFPELRLIGRDNPHLSLDLLVLELFLQLPGLFGNPLLLPVDLPQLGVLLGHRLLPRRAVVILEIGHDLLQVVHIDGVLSELTLDLSERLVI